MPVLGPCLVLPSDTMAPRCRAQSTPHCCAAPGIFTYRSQGRKNSYILNTNPTSFRSAQTFCNAQGGHLASWDSYAEQYEVEQYFVNQVRVLASCRPAQGAAPAKGPAPAASAARMEPAAIAT